MRVRLLRGNIQKCAHLHKDPPFETSALSYLSPPSWNQLLHGHSVKCIRHPTVKPYNYAFSSVQAKINSTKINLTDNFANVEHKVGSFWKYAEINDDNLRAMLFCEIDSTTTYLRIILRWLKVSGHGPFKLRGVVHMLAVQFIKFYSFATCARMAYGQLHVDLKLRGTPYRGEAGRGVARIKYETRGA